MIRTLMESKDFLALTLAFPNRFDGAETLQLGEHTKVTIKNTGVLAFEPLTPIKKDIVISSGIHGNETAPVELCNNMIQRLLSEEIKTSHRILFIFGNPLAMFNGTRIVDENLNRLFSGEHSRGTGLVNPERHRAKLLEQVLTDFFSSDECSSSSERKRIHYDLHTAIRGSKHEKFAIYPFKHGRLYSKEQLNFLAAAGVDSVLFYHEPATTFSYFSSKTFNAEAFTIELGKVFPMGQNDLSHFSAMERMLTQLIVSDELVIPDYDPLNMHLYRVSRSIVKQTDKFEFTFDNEVENFTCFKQGEVLAYDGKQKLVVEAEEEAIVFPNAKVPVGQRSLLCLTPMTTLELSKRM